MKVQLIVVQGKPEGKVIPLLGPTFKIGRGETCHLRPNSEQVSREHAEFTMTANQVLLKDLGSRNGTLVNGKALTGSYTLKDRDLVQIGQLTFAVSIEHAPATAAPTAAAPPKGTTRAASPDDVSQNEIESWLIADEANQPPERPSGVYGGDTMTISAFKEAGSPKPKHSVESAAPTPPPAAAPAPAPAPTPAARPAPAPAAGPAPAPAAGPAPAPASPPRPAPTPPPVDPEEEEYERLPEGEGDVEELADSDEMSDDSDDSDSNAEEYIDESNPFYVKKAKESEAPAKQSFKDTSDAASDILRRLMDKRRGPK